MAGIVYKLPGFPICGQGRSGCTLMGFHGNCGPRTKDEATRINAWRAACDEVGLVVGPGSAKRVRAAYQRLMRAVEARR